MYEGRNRMTYTFPPVTFTGDVTHYIVGPKGRGAHIQDYGVIACTTTFAGATTTPMMKIGKSGTLEAYGKLLDFGLLTTAIGMKSMRTTYQDYERGAGSATGYTDFIVASIPKDTQVYVTCVAATGGGAAGVATPFVILDWDW